MRLNSIQIASLERLAPAVIHQIISAQKAVKDEVLNAPTHIQIDVRDGYRHSDYPKVLYKGAGHAHEGATVRQVADAEQETAAVKDGFHPYKPKSAESAEEEVSA